MKLNFGKRLLLFLHWILAAALFVAFLRGVTYVSAEELLRGLFDQKIAEIVFIALCAVYAVFCLVVLCVILKRGDKRSERGFITVDSSETGRVRISVGAIEQMVKQAVGAVDGIADMRISISNMDDAIAINVNVSMINGSHVPTVTMNMQRAIRQFVEMNCGVAVRSVAINVQNVVNPEEAAKKGKRPEMGPMAAQGPLETTFPAEPPAAPIAESQAVEAVSVDTGAYEPAEPVNDATIAEMEDPECIPVQEAFAKEQNAVEEPEGERETPDREII